MFVSFLDFPDVGWSMTINDFAKEITIFFFCVSVKHRDINTTCRVCVSYMRSVLPSKLQLCMYIILYLYIHIIFKHEFLNQYL